MRTQQRSPSNMGGKVKYHFEKDKDWLNEHYIVKNMSIQKIADAESVPYHVVRNALLKAGIAMKPQKIYGFVNHPNRKKENHPRWKGGLPNCKQCGKQVSFYKDRCKDCYGLSRRKNKEDKVNIRPSQIDRYTPEYIKWRTAVFKHYNFKCYICGNKDRNSVVHHLNSFSEFPEERYDFDNGLVLCNKHHKNFHLNYGYKGNTKNQFYDYLSQLAEII